MLFVNLVKRLVIKSKICFKNENKKLFIKIGKFFWCNNVMLVDE